jgi:hypothetical protein
VKEYTIQTFDRDAGNLWAAFGFRVHPQNHFGLDWALVKLPGHRPIPNLNLNVMAPSTPPSSSTILGKLAFRFILVLFLLLLFFQRILLQSFHRARSILLSGAQTPSSAPTPGPRREPLRGFTAINRLPPLIETSSGLPSRAPTPARGELSAWNVPQGEVDPCRIACSPVRSSDWGCCYHVGVPHSSSLWGPPLQRDGRKFALYPFISYNISYQFLLQRKSTSADPCYSSLQIKNSLPSDKGRLYPLVLVRNGPLRGCGVEKLSTLCAR